MAGSIGPKFLSAARRVLSIGRLVSAASACADSGPAGGQRGAMVASVRGEGEKQEFSADFHVYVPTLRKSNALLMVTLRLAA